jgi:hypothetical protein
MNNNTFNILFYSRNCQSCQHLLNLLKNENLLGYFKLYCVDDRINNIPEYIEYVPTMIVTENGKQLKFERQGTFEWVQKVKFIRQKNIIDNDKRIIQQNLSNMANTAKQGPVGFKSIEMSSISDTFAYKDIDRPMPQSFVSIGEEDKQFIYTPPHKKEDTISKDMQSKLLSSIESQRKDHDTQFSEMMKQQRIHAIVDANNI